MIILVDQDQVLADYEGGFLRLWKQIYPDRIAVPLEQRLGRKIIDSYPEEYYDDVMALQWAEGFYRSLPPLKKNIEVVKEMHSAGHQVYICTSPKTSNPYCETEKRAWAVEHLGPEWQRRMIITKDKTFVRGHILIDDKPEVTGICQPTWTHLLARTWYNRDINKPAMDWNNWEECVEPYKLNLI